MKFIGTKGRYCILPSSGERFFPWAVIDIDDPTHIKSNPRILPFLAEWFDQVCPGQWGTVYTEHGAAIWIEDRRIAQLFKLAWSGHTDITRPPEMDSAAFYCPYIPLTTTSASLASPKVSIVSTP